MKLVKERQESILGNIQEQLAAAAESVKTDLTGISDKFNPQLHHLLSRNNDADSNVLLQERVSKGCRFFAEKISGTINERLDAIILETDNKEVRKSITEALERVRTEVALKLACLQACISGFVVKKYLEVKAKASIEVPQARTKQAKSVEDNSGIISHSGLYNRIKSWRDRTALESGLPLYMILPQKTMAALANLLPQSMASLMLVKGMGKKKSEQFGEDLLEMIRDYCGEKNIKPPPLVLPVVQKPAKIKTDTRLVSYNLFKAGNTVQEIALHREMAVTTIEEHLAYYVGTGDLPIHEFVSPAMTRLIASHFEGSGDFKLGPVKAALGNQVSWSEIKFVIRHLQYTGKMKPA